jgi:hypothetical protein
MFSDSASSSATIRVSSTFGFFDAMDSIRITFEAGTSPFTANSAI